jgi:hypothetical protein
MPSVYVYDFYLPHLTRIPIKHEQPIYYHTFEITLSFATLVYSDLSIHLICSEQSERRLLEADSVGRKPSPLAVSLDIVVRTFPPATSSSPI